MRGEQLTLLRNDEILRKRLAKAMALECFRNTKLEDFHAGTTPSSEMGDYSDVKVVSPNGEIPWAKVSRLNDEEMKALMIDVVNRSYAFLSFLFGKHSGGEFIELLKQHDPVPKWDDPEMPAK